MNNRQHKGSVIWSLALHVAVAAVVVIGLPWRIERPRVAVNAAPIQGVIIDQKAIERERLAREDAARQVRQQQQREDRQRREAAEQERQRVAAKAQAEQQERDRVAAEKAAEQRREREAEAERERVAREREEQAKREREAAEKRAAEQRRRQAEAELAAQVALEAEANAARAAGLLDQYMLMIQTHVKRHWERPLSARPGLDCWVKVVQLPTGDVVSATVERCNGDEAVRRSIENAVRDASPLPRPPSQAVFSRTFDLNFAPEE